MAGSRTLKLSILADVDDLKKKLDTGSKEVEGFGGKMEKFGKMAAAAFAAAAAAAAAYAVKLAVDGVKAAIEDEAAQARLAAALKNVTDATDIQIAALENQILKTSLATGVADDQLRPALQRLATATGDVKKSQELLNLALDISAATGKSVETVSNALGKAYEGNTGALSRLGIGLSTAEINALGLEGTMAQLADTFGGAATVQANTLEGQISRLKILFQETQESVGEGLLPTVKNFLDYVTNRLIPILIDAKEKSIDKVTAAFENNREEMEALIAFGKKYLIPFFEQTLVKKIELVASVISNTIKVIGAVIRGIETIINKAIDAINVFIRAYNAIPDILKPGKGNIPLLNNVNFNKNDAESGQINTSTGSIFIPTPFVPPAPITPASPNAKSSASSATSVPVSGSKPPKVPSSAVPSMGAGAFANARLGAEGDYLGANGLVINVNAPSVIDEEGFTRAVVSALNNTGRRTGAGVEQLAI